MDEQTAKKSLKESIIEKMFRKNPPSPTIPRSKVATLPMIQTPRVTETVLSIPMTERVKAIAEA